MRGKRKIECTCKLINILFAKRIADLLCRTTVGVEGAPWRENSNANCSLPT